MRGCFNSGRRLPCTAAGDNDTPDADKNENSSQEKDNGGGGDCEGVGKEAGGRKEEEENNDNDGIEITDDQLSGLYGRISALRQRDVEVRSSDRKQPFSKLRRSYVFRGTHDTFCITS